MSDIFQNIVDSVKQEMLSQRKPNERFLNYVCFKMKKTEANPWQIFLIPALGEVSIPRVMKGRFIDFRIAARPIFLREEQDILNANVFRLSLQKYEYWEQFIGDEIRVLEHELEVHKEHNDPYKKWVQHTIDTYIPKIKEFSQHHLYKTPKPPPRKPRKEDQLKLFY